MNFYRVSLLTFLFITILLIVLPFIVFASRGQQTMQQHAATNSLTAPSGEALPIGDLPGWHQIFTDDFTTDVPLGSFPSAVSSTWDAYPDGWKDTSKNGTYYPSKVVSIQNGVMNLYLHTENGIHMVSAPEPKLPGAIGTEGGLLYSRYVIRFKADPVPGYKTAWLLWPDSETWPRDGEIDFPEGDLTSTICAYMHRQNGTSGGDQDEYCTQTTYSSWHTAIIEWLPTRLTFILDGQTIGTSTSRIPNTPMHWVIQTETALNGTPPSDTAAGNVQIDWVAVYVPSPTNSPSISTPTSIPTPTVVPGNTSFLVTVCPHGIGNCGDNVNPTSGGNTSPKHPQRTITLTLLNAQNQPVTTTHGTVSYNSSSGNFQGTISGTIPSGNYLVEIQTDGYLPRQAPGIITVTTGQQIMLPSVSLVTGDINNDSQLDILDYNILVSCFGSKKGTASCTAPPNAQSPGADIDDDGTVDGADYNLFLRELSVQKSG